MPSSRGPSGTLPRSESEIVVDFARQQSSEDDMSHDSLNEGDCQSQSERRDSKNISRDSLYMDESDGDGGWSRRASQGEKSFQDDLESDNWHREKAEGNASRGSVKVVDSNMKRRITDEIYGKQPSPISSPTYSFRSTIDLLPSSRKRRGLRQQVVVTFACCLGPLACGFALAYNMTKNPAELMRPSLGAWKTYVYLLGCLAGGFFSGCLANYGRKVVLLLTMVPLALSWLFVIFAMQVWMVFLFHATSGVCTGIIMVIAQVYVAEVSVPRIRGAISSAPLLAFQVGCLLCFLLGEILVWKNLAIVGICTTMPFFVSVVLCMPESPRFLIHVRPNDALSTLQWLRGVDNDVMEEYHEITNSCEIDRWRIACEDLIRPTFWRPLLISCGLMFLYNMTGVASFTLYGMELFSKISSSYNNAAYFIVTVVLIVAITLSALLVDHIGRKLLLLLSLTIMAASAFVLGLFLFLKDLHKVENYFTYQWIAEVFCVVLFTFAHGTGVGPIAWVTLGEIFGSRQKWIAFAMVLRMSPWSQDRIAVRPGLCSTASSKVHLMSSNLEEELDNISKPLYLKAVVCIQALAGRRIRSLPSFSMALLFVILLAQRDIPKFLMEMYFMIGS
ncbi:facilitated trehalose transporter Tret1-like [Penaeus monodon]|uniref:facilitated trehalose transporter Tret1-like n=1 Tax=Penaeus monodon TaxID=6687 RepID=UPI0018A79900|nr:facilitated trehalose transporter Tret1-like [Penaeus monodon]